MLKYVMRVIGLPLMLILGPTVVAAANTPTLAVDSSTENAAVSSSAKIGVLDWSELLTNAPQADAAGKRLEREFQSRKDAVMAKQKEFQTKQERATRDKDVMTATERKDLELELSALQQDLRHQDEKLRSDYTARHREEMDAFLQVVREVVDNFAKAKDLRLVLPKDATVYTADSIDITEKILDDLRKLKSTKIGKTDDSKSKK